MSKHQVRGGDIAGLFESHVVDPASIATSRRRRRDKADGVDGEALVRALLAHKRGEPRVCAWQRRPRLNRRTVGRSAVSAGL